jgi:hypothetical protein
LCVVGSPSFFVQGGAFHGCLAPFDVGRLSCLSPHYVLSKQGGAFSDTFSGAIFGWLVVVANCCGLVAGQSVSPKLLSWVGWY